MIKSRFLSPCKVGFFFFLSSFLNLFCIFCLQTGLTSLHLAAQEDKVNVAEILTKHGANQDAQTKVNCGMATVSSVPKDATVVKECSTELAVSQFVLLL